MCHYYTQLKLIVIYNLTDGTEVKFCSDRIIDIKVIEEIILRATDFHAAPQSMQQKLIYLSNRWFAGISQSSTLDCFFFACFIFAERVRKRIAFALFANL